MDVAELIRSHYSGADLASGILAALAAAGVDTDALSAATLAPVDQLHAGGPESTRYLFDRMALTADSRLLDVGSGIGGPARLAAATYRCHVVGVDLSPDFVAAARDLTARVRLAGQVEYVVASATDTGLPEASFDRASLIHVGMNLPDKPAVFAEVRRLLSPGGVFGLYEQMRVSAGALPYPLPWAEDERSSFVATEEEYVAALEEAGFRITAHEDRTTAVSGGPGGGRPSGPNQVAVFGPEFVERIRNNIAATQAGLLAPVVILAEAV